MSHPGHNVPFNTEFGGVDLVGLPRHLGAAAEVRSVACLAARMKTQRLAGGRATSSSDGDRPISNSAAGRSRPGRIRRRGAGCDLPVNHFPLAAFATASINPAARGFDTSREMRIDEGLTSLL